MMPRKRHRKSNSSKTPRVTHVEKLRVLSRAGVKIDPTNKRGVTRAFKNYNTTKSMARPVSKDAARDFKKHSFHVVGKSVIVDSPRDKKGRKIKGVKTRALSGGVITTSVKSRRDYVYGFTAKEKKEFAKNPELMTAQVLTRLKKRFPTMRKSRKTQTRLQWGSFRATKDFAVDYWTKLGSGQYLLRQSPEMKRKGEKGKLIDKLTGLHFVVHSPNTARKRRKSNGSKKK